MKSKLVLVQALLVKPQRLNSGGSELDGMSTNLCLCASMQLERTHQL